ncbi:undecaprenyl diphosphate synthase family protein [Methanolobus sp. ZRKC2]|uniref:undecaprenyl diphosphate synthase family protein n=1 Tax=Methanolobus sp. ZRKC2 TaxID=3125783 RepID=UPI0032443EF5
MKIRVPRHVGVIPDGNRRWAVSKGLSKEKGYQHGLSPGLEMYRLCRDAGVQEVTFYGFTMDNAKRSLIQRISFSETCIEAVKLIAKEDSAILVVGDTKSPVFPEELLPFTERKKYGKGGIKVNFLINYGWQWDLRNLIDNNEGSKTGIIDKLRSKDISRIDLIIRWGERKRLSGFLPVQSVYADLYVVNAYWPDFKPDHFYEALEWYEKQDITLGG